MSEPIQPVVMLDIDGTSLTAEDRELFERVAVGCPVLIVE